MKVRSRGGGEIKDYFGGNRNADCGAEEDGKMKAEANEELIPKSWRPVMELHDLGEGSPSDSTWDVWRYLIIDVGATMTTIQFGCSRRSDELENVSVRDWIPDKSM